MSFWIFFLFMNWRGICFPFWPFCYHALWYCLGFFLAYLLILCIFFWLEKFCWFWLLLDKAFVFFGFCLIDALEGSVLFFSPFCYHGLWYFTWFFFPTFGSFFPHSNSLYVFSCCLIKFLSVFVIWFSPWNGWKSCFLLPFSYHVSYTLFAFYFFL